MNQSVSLDYSIVSCGSEDPQFPIGSIQNSTIRSSGWQSEPNPRYPIEFMVDLGNKCDLTTLQFVSHQGKIAQRVDLFVSETSETWRALGSFQFSDNSHTRYSARELKSANLQRISSRFIKVSIAGCHKNLHNPQDQVGIVSLKIMGKGGRPASAVMRPQSSRPATAVGNPVDLSARVTELERRKAEAVASEDFVEAAAVKRELDAIKEKRDTLLQLERAKQEAIASEDFEMARQCKEKIEAILSGGSAPPPPRQQQQQQQQQSYPAERPSRAKPVESAPTPREEPMDVAPPRPARRVEPRPPSGNEGKMGEFDVPEVAQANGSDLSEDRPICGRRMMSDEADDDGDDGLPAGLPNFKIDNLAGTLTAHPDEDVPACDETPDELKPGDRQEATVLLGVAGEDIIRRFFSKNWLLKIQGVKMLVEKVSNMASDYSPAFQNFCYLCRHRVQDTQKQTVIAVLNGIRTIVETHQIEPPELTKGIAHILNLIVPKIGGSQQATTDAVADFLVWMSQRRALDVVLPIVMGPAKKAQTWKGTQAKIDVLHNIILLHGIDAEPGLTTPDVMKFLVPSVESAKVEVRQSAIEVIVTLESMVGSSINKYIEGVNVRTKREIEKAIESHQGEEDED